MIEELNILIKEWESEAKYLNNPWDDERDRYAGQTYSECAKKLKEVLASQQANAPDVRKQCHICKVGIGEYHKGYCSAGVGKFAAGD